MDRSLSRRSLMRAAAGGAGALALAGCGVPPAYVPPGERAAPDRSKREHRLDFANWPLYIDVAEGNEQVRPTLREFTRRTGISVKYVEEINDNDEFFGKVSPALQNGQPLDRDIIVPSDWMGARYVKLGWVQRLDSARLGNVRANLDPLLRDPPFDPGRHHSVPWQSGITGIAYNRKRLGREIRSVSDLWADDLRGRVTLFSAMDEAPALLLMGRGADSRAFTADQYYDMVDEVRRLVAKKHIRRFTGNDYTKDLASGDVLACQAWSGDVIQLQADNEDIEFVVPEEGGELWSDSLMVPNKAAHKANAEALMNYYYEPEVAARLAAWVNYVCPVPAARDVLASSKDKDTAALAEDPLIFPTASMRRRLQVMRDITPEERPGFSSAWNKVVGL
ncbi:polyamine ABC transporter substrate-binding protein [Wenjunlia tyrosinilytica]|uniref:Polyamine-binding lipoprotein n=1 Tax=Wenjunlia tyrosinilytica TaxID=1544741 RepID=A0A918E0P7_9ACTN|nr:spermidine/putrescine ABC transporter substrate-binding protein [Wenjunlia tyrosinilytica]GGO93656.1 polyamine-binding lipoprotein [Wenjunlia tyrosinilytica]